MTGMIIGLDTCLCCKSPAAIGMLNGCDEVRSISFIGTDALGRRLGDASCLAMMCRHGTVSLAREAKAGQKEPSGSGGGAGGRRGPELHKGLGEIVGACRGGEKGRSKDAVSIGVGYAFPWLNPLRTSYPSSQPPLADALLALQCFPLASRWMC